MQRFTELRVWQLAYGLVVDIYRLTAGFPEGERYGLTQQLRRAASSVPANIAEGSKRRSNALYAHHLNTAEASLAETEYHLILSRDLELVASPTADGLVSRIGLLAKRLHVLRIKVGTQRDE